MNKQEIQDRLCLFIDKLNCSTRTALSMGFSLHPDYWNLVHVPPYASCNDKLIWKLSPNVLSLQAGMPNKRLHPMSCMLVGRYTTTGNRCGDIERMMGFHTPGVMDRGFLRTFRGAPSGKSIAEDSDYQYNTTIFSQSWNLGAYCMNVLFGYANGYHLTTVLKSAVDNAFKDLKTPFVI